LKPVPYIFLLCVSLFLVGCDLSFGTSVRSGTTEDDYVEEPLSDGVKKFEQALITSNAVLELISKSKHQEIFANYFSDDSKSNFARSDLTTLLNQLDQGAGKLVDFKKLQWGFFNGKEKGIDYLYSVKIAEHEKTMIRYLFVFEKDKPYTHLAGLFMKVREGTLPPGNF